MRTKHLLMAIALPTIFAACSSDELETIQNGGNALKGRVELGNVELSFGDDAQTRMTAEGGQIGFLTGDGVGACLVDNYKKVSDKPEEILKNYPLASYIQTNYQYKYDGSTWTTTARMVEGNYIFYAPYNGEHLSRTPLKTGVPVVQELALGADGKLDQYSILDAFVKSGQPAYVGYKFLKAEGQTTKVSVDMKPIFAYPLVTFTNDKTTGADAGDVTITKFVIKKETGGFATEAPLAIGTANAVASKDATGIVGSLFDATEKAEDKGAWVGTGTKKGSRTANVTGEAEKTSNMITVNVPGGALKVAKGETVKFNVVIPAEAANYVIYAYLDNGMAYKNEIKGNSYSTGKIYADSQYNSDGTARPSQVAFMAWKTNGLTPAVAPVIVNTTEELINLVSGAANNIGNIEIGGSDVKITKAVVDAANPGLTYTFADEVSVAAGTDKIELNTFVFSQNVTVESGDVTYNNKNAAINAVVKKGAKLTVKAAVADDKTTSENEAVSTVETEVGATAVIGNEKDDEVVIKSLTNAGETTIEATGVVLSDNASTSEVERGIANTGKIINKSKALPEVIEGVWENYGRVKLEKDTKIKKDGVLTNGKDATIEVISTKGLTIEYGATLNNTADGILVNGGSVNVNGTLEAYGMFTGNVITATKGTDAAGVGRINVHQGCTTEKGFTTPTDGSHLVDVRDSYNAGDENEIAILATANMLSVKNLTVIATKDKDSEKKTGLNMVPNYELKDGGKLTLKGDVATTAPTNIFVKGNATVEGLFSLAGDATNTLTITVDKKKTLTVKGTTLGNSQAKTGTVLKGTSKVAGENAMYKDLTGSVDENNCTIEVDEKGNDGKPIDTTGSIEKVE